ncbi:hypothetical protein [Emcibacter sp. SYSU 3D8]|uniref:hypothetical protein n=1 Tax=Emcibacter sp. SYSU 3D8 TaxID=3133969 RepID=UPI0031FEE162
MTMRVGLLTVGLAAFPASPLLACTLCHSETAEAVRERLFQGDFLINLALVAAPMAALGVVVAFALYARSS